MGETIDFPNNFEGYVSLGKQAVADGKMLSAKEHFEAAYNLQQSFVVNHQLVSILLELGEYQQAHEFAKEMSSEYEKEVETLKVYVMVLEMNHEFLAATQLIKHKLRNTKAAQSLALIDLEKEVEVASEHYRKFDKKAIQDLKNLFQSLGNYSFGQQTKLIKQAQKLPQEDFIEICREHLVNSDFHEIIRSSLLETLVMLELNQVVKITDNQQKVRAVVPESLTKIIDNQLYLAVVKQLEGELLDNNPSLLKMLVEETRLYFAILYPFPEEVITDVGLWTQVHLQQYLQTSSIDMDSVGIEYQRMRAELTKLQEKIASLIIC